MRRGIRKVTLLCCLIIFLLPVVSSVSIDLYEQKENIEIIQVTQRNTIINNNDLYSELLIEAVVNDTSQLKAYSTARLNLEFNERGKRLPVERINTTVWVNCTGGYPYGDGKDERGYKNIFVDCNNVIFQDYNNSKNYRMEEEFKITELPAWSAPPSTTYPFYIKSEYYIKDFVMTNGDYYYIGWLQTLCQSCPDDSKIKRTLMLPQNTVIESWNNFKVIDMRDGSWVLEFTF